MVCRQCGGRSGSIEIGKHLPNGISSRLTDFLAHAERSRAQLRRLAVRYTKVFSFQTPIIYGHFLDQPTHPRVETAQTEPTVF